MTVTDGPYAEAKEVIGGWAIVKFDTEEQARAEGQEMADLHLTALARLGGRDRDPPDRRARRGADRRPDAAGPAAGGPRLLV